MWTSFDFEQNVSRNISYCTFSCGRECGSFRFLNPGLQGKDFNWDLLVKWIYIAFKYKGKNIFVMQKFQPWSGPHRAKCCACAPRRFYFSDKPALWTCLWQQFWQKIWSWAGKELSAQRCFDQLHCLGLCSWQRGWLQKVSVLNRGQMQQAGKGPSSLE